MLNFELGRTYVCTLQSSKRVVAVLHGTMLGTNGATEYDVTVNGIRQIYADLNTALGEPVLSVEPL